MKTFEQRLVDAVVAKRTDLGLSIRGLATQVGVSFSTLARIERGDGVPDVNSRIRLLGWLGPDAQGLDGEFENVAQVHFRAMKNVRSGTVQSLLKAASCLKNSSPTTALSHGETVEPTDTEPYPELSKEQLEGIAARFRKDLDLDDGVALDPLAIEVEGIEVARLTQTKCLDQRTAYRLGNEACSEWSAMSVPLDASMDNWVVLLNDKHTVERQRVTLLEEYWHILMGHKPTRIVRVAEAYGRTYDKAEEDDAFYLASASLLPRNAIKLAVEEGHDPTFLARHYGTSNELVAYRIKRLGLWREHVGKRVVLKG